MTLAAEMTTDLTAFFDTDAHATAVTYAGAAVTAIVDYGENLDEMEGAALSRAIIWVKVSDVAAPAYRDAVVIGSDTWTVRRVMTGDGYVWQIEIQRDERPMI